MNNEHKKALKRILGYYFGQASMCWSKTPKGIFDSTRALSIVEETAKNIDFLLKNEHVESSNCWCDPILKNDFSEQGGAKHYVHNNLTKGDQSE